MKLEINYREKNVKNTKKWRLKKNGSKKKPKRKSENILRQMKLKHNFPKSMGCSKSGLKMEIYSVMVISPETRKNLAFLEE